MSDAAGPSLRLALSATRAEVGRALDEVRAHLEAKGVESDVVDDVCLVVDEVLANVVLHGYAEDAGARAFLDLVVTEDGCSVEIRDRAPAFDPLSVSAPELGDDPEGRGVGGLGVHLMRSLMDELAYERRGDENVLRARRARRRT